MRRLRKQLDLRPQTLGVLGGNRAARTSPIVDVAELRAQERSLEFVQTLVVPGQRVRTVGVASQVTQTSCSGGQDTVASADSTAIAERTKVLARIEAERRCMPEAAGASATIGRPVGLGRVLE